MTSTTRLRPSRRAVLGSSLGLALTGAGASAWALDRYVVDHVEATNVSQNVSDAVIANAASTKGTYTSSGYTSDTTTITISTKSWGSGDSKVTAYLAEVEISDATIVRSAFANDQFGQNIIANPSTIAAQANAVLAINGDYYGFRDTGIQIRNGVIYRDEGARQGLAMYSDGSMRLYDETSTSAKELLASGVWNTLSFGPGLVENGKVLSGIESVEVDTNFGNHSVQGYQPRTGIGAISDNHLLFVAVDGRSAGYSRGVTMTEMAQFFVDNGAQVDRNGAVFCRQRGAGRLQPRWRRLDDHGL